MSKQILVAIDFTPITTHLIQEAVRLAEPGRAKVRLIHVVGKDTMTLWFDRMTEFTVFGAPEQSMLEQMRMKLADRADELIAQLAKDFSKPDVEVTGRVARGSVVDEVVKEAKAIRADLLICAAHQHESLSHTLLGSVASKLAEKAPCSVMVVRQPADTVRD